MDSGGLWACLFFDVFLKNIFGGSFAFCFKERGEMTEIEGSE